MTRAAPTLATLRRLARLAAETGQEAGLQTPDGTTIRIAPKGATLAPGPAPAPPDEVDAWFAREGLRDAG